MKTRVAVGICTRNRPVWLKRCLKALSNSDYRIDELVVVEDIAESQNFSADLIKAFFSYQLEVKYLTVTNRPIGFSRNVVLDHAAAALLFFVDDDVLVGRDFLGKILETFQRLPRQSTVLLFNKVRPIFLNRFSYFYSLYFNQEKINWSEISLLTVFPFSSVLMNLDLIKKNQLRFNDDLTSGEDIDFAFKVTRRNLKNYYHPHLVSFHNFPISLGGMIKKTIFHTKNINFLSHNFAYGQKLSLIKLLNPKTYFSAARDDLYFFKQLAPQPKYFISDLVMIHSLLKNLIYLAKFISDGLRQAFFNLRTAVVVQFFPIAVRLIRPTPVVFSPTFGLVTLLCSKYVDYYICSINSLFFFSQRSFPLFVLSDGSLTAQDKRKLAQSFPGIMIKDRSWAEAQMVEKLKNFPSLAWYRFLGTGSYKLKLDTVLFNPFTSFLYLDPDILFKSLPQELASWCQQPDRVIYTVHDENFFLDGYYPEFILRRQFLNSHRLKMIGGFSSGLMGFPDKKILSLPIMDKIFSLFKAHGYINNAGAEEFMFGILMTNIHSVCLPQKKYLVAAFLEQLHSRDNESVVMSHYGFETKKKFKTEAVKLMLHHNFFKPLQ